MKVTRLAFGTGSNNGHVQAALGQKEFSRLIAYAYDHGIRFFETAEVVHDPGDAGRGSEAVSARQLSVDEQGDDGSGVDPQKRFDEMRRVSQTEYFDIMLLHWQHTDDWMAETKPWQDGMLKAQSKNIIKTRGASVHGLPALRQVPGNKFLEVAMIRMNHNGTRMDAAIPDGPKPGNVQEVVAHVKQVKSEGMGVISMKLCGDGTFTQHEDRQAAMRFAFQTRGYRLRDRGL